MLGHLGYEVTVAAEGRQAVELYREAFNDGECFDIVVLDLTVPGGLGGSETAREILALDPEARVIVSSGYGNDPVMANYREYGFHGVIPKPYKIEELGKALRDLLA
jgi:CheY-like chemotaxis protein